MAPMGWPDSSAPPPSQSWPHYLNLVQPLLSKAPHSSHTLTSSPLPSSLDDDRMLKVAEQLLTLNLDSSPPSLPTASTTISSTTLPTSPTSSFLLSAPSTSLTAPSTSLTSSLSLDFSSLLTSPTLPSSPSSSSSPPPVPSIKADSPNPEDEANPRFKTELCRNFQEKRKCGFGDSCQFAHGAKELRQLGLYTNYKTKRCRKYWVLGTCHYGLRCNFIHMDKEAKAGRRTRAEGKAVVQQLCRDSGLGSPTPLPSPRDSYKAGWTLGEGGSLRPSPSLPLHTLAHGSGRIAYILPANRSIRVDKYTFKVLDVWDTTGETALLEDLKDDEDAKTIVAG